MNGNRPTRAKHTRIPNFESIESRLVPASIGPLARLHAAAALAPRAFPSDGATAILSALNGGLGSEFVQNLRRQIGNPLRLIGEFASGARNAFATRGFAALTHTTLSTYTGGHADAILPRVAGAVVLPTGRISLGAIMRGPMDELNEGARYVWALDLGRGATQQFAEYPGIRADTIVRVDIGQDRRPTLTIDNLVNGTSRTLSPSLVKIVGPTIRLRLSAADLGTTTRALGKAKFAFWVHEHPGGLETVPNFLPPRSVPVGSLARR